MKVILISLAAIAVIVIALVVFAVVKFSSSLNKAQGHALYSGVGAWTRLKEFAHAEGKSNYIAEAEKTLAQLESDLKAWRESAPAGTDFTALEKARATAYATTERNIKNGQNPLAYLDAP